MHRPGARPPELAQAWSSRARASSVPELARAQARSSHGAWPLCSAHHSLWPPAGAALNPDPDDGTGDGDEGTLLHSTLTLSLALSLAPTLTLTLTSF